MARVCVCFAEGFEEVEAVTPVDLLRRAGIEVIMAGIGNSDTVTGSHGIGFKMDCRFSEVDFSKVDMLLLPGGMPGTRHLGECDALKKQLTEFNREGKKIAAICAAPSVLGDLGLLNGKKAVCYPGFEERLTGALIGKEKVIADGNVTTSRGAGTAIAFSLSLIEQLAGAAEGEKIRTSILYGHSYPENS